MIFMHIDPFTLTVLNTITSLLMTTGLFALSRSHFNEIKGIRHWAAALLLISIGSGLMSLSGKVADFIPMVIGTSLLILATAVYYHALLLFKEIRKPVQWSYACVALGFIGNFYFVSIDFNLNAKIAVNSTVVAILMSTSAKLLLAKNPDPFSISHRLTGIFFALCGFIYAIRAIYYAAWHPQSENTLFHVNLIQSISYLLIPITVIAISFGFALMCVEKYLDEKIRAQLAQQEVLERLHKIANQLPSVVFQFVRRSDGSFYLPYASEVLRRIYRLSPEQVCEDASAVFANVHPDDLTRHLEGIKISAQQLSPWKDEYRLKFADGTERWLWGNALPQREADGSTLWHGFVMDITERKQAEQRLQLSERRFRDLFENAPLAYQSLDIEGNIIDVNQAWLDLVGCSREQALGQFFGDLMTESSLTLMQKTFGQFKQDGHVSSPTFELVRRDTGKTHLIMLEGRIARDSQGVFQRTHCILIDITEQEQMQQQLRESEAFTNSILNSLTAHIAVLDANGTIIAVNEAWRKFGDENGLPKTRCSSF